MLPLELDHRFPADPREIARARQVLRAWLTDDGISGDDADDLVLVMSELTTNAVKAAGHVDVTVGPVEIGLAVWREAGPRVVIEVTGPSLGFDPTILRHRAWSSISESGRGLAIVDVLSDSVEAERAGPSIVFRATRSVRPSVIDLREEDRARR